MLKLDIFMPEPVNLCYAWGLLMRGLASNALIYSGSTCILKY